MTAYWIAFTPDGKSLLSGNYCFDANTGRERWAGERMSAGNQPSQGIDGTRIQTGADPATTRRRVRSIQPKPA
jgi:hypothetical protein